MLGKILLIISLFASGALASDNFSRKGAKAQSEDNISLRSYSAPLRLCGRNDLVQANDLPIEVFQVLDLPLPAVMRMPNEVDAPHPNGPRVIFDK
jgi:hypothetical protein